MLKLPGQKLTLNLKPSLSTSLGLKVHHKLGKFNIYKNFAEIVN